MRMCSWNSSLVVFNTLIMFVSSVLFLALAATGLAQAPPEGYRKVLITSKVNAKFVVVPKARTAGSTTIMYVPSRPG